MTNDYDYMTPTEVARAFRVSTMTVYRLLRSGDLPSIRIGRSFRVRQADIDEYIVKAAIAES